MHGMECRLDAKVDVNEMHGVDDNIMLSACSAGQFGEVCNEIHYHPCRQLS